VAAAPSVSAYVVRTSLLVGRRSSSLLKLRRSSRAVLSRGRAPKRAGL